MEEINLLRTIESIYIDISKASKYVTYYIKDREGNYINKTRDNKIITNKTHSNGVYFVNIDYYYDIIDYFPLDIYKIYNKGKYIYIQCECNWWIRFILNEELNEELIVLNSLFNISNLIISNNILLLEKFIPLKMDIDLFILKIMEYKNDTIFNGLKSIFKIKLNMDEINMDEINILSILNKINIDKNIKINKIDILIIERIFNLIKLN